jgi:hypothetical protein
MVGSRKDEQRYINEVIAWAKKHSKDQYAGTIVRIPHADSYAMYITFKSSPVTLIHLNIGDGWDAPLAHRLLKKDIVDYAKRKW